ncbi:DUF2076 domain-containing protein [Ancylobacter mangrovi]|uniref:DUF2076 domain-containing protein n=1 Tax=Ancylobacter mangrovi TaxID=2972472 RepID=UPI002163907F|nr:DUF2076 domain-containing protein [Ancylobacter mangrovi]MCS0502273.1 DUF2076 domain-containing protein [Ancylobacter mangrovi]
MNEQDRQAIDGLFARLAEAEQRSGPRDGEAEGFIAERVAGQPAAPYLMAQTIVMQDYALQQAQARIEALERQAAELERQAAETAQQAPASGGFLGGLFGSSQPPQRRSSVPAMPRAATPAAVPAGPGPSGNWGPSAGGPPQGAQPGVGAGMQPGFGARPGFGGGGFLAGAAQTAMGVAGGVLLGHAIAGMFGGSEAQAAEVPADTSAATDTSQDTEADASAQDAAAQDASYEPDQSADAGYDDISASDEGGWFDGGGFFGDGEI